MYKIPNIYHFIFGFKPQSEEFHLAYYLCIESCIQVNKPEKIFFHYRNLPYGKLWEKIRSTLTLNKIEDIYFVENFTYADKTIEQFRYAHIADIVRLEVLKKYGGIYADIDTLFVNPLPAHLFCKEFILGHEKVDSIQPAAIRAGGSLCNAWIASAKDSTFCTLWLNTIREEFDGSWSAHSTFLPYKLSQQYAEFIHVEPERSFFYFDWSAEGIDRIFYGRELNLDGVYSIHLWSHLWWSPKKNNFSKFNNKMLTDRYVRSGSSNYSKLASRFLPEAKNNLSRYLNYLLMNPANPFSALRNKPYDK